MRITRLKGFLIILFFHFGCSTSGEKEFSGILPPNIDLNLVSSFDEIVSISKVYSLEGITETVDFSSFPLVKIKRKFIKKWHRVSHGELTDLKLFFDEVPIRPSIENMVVNGLETSEENLVSYVYSENSDGPPGSKGYLLGTWIDIFYLDISRKELIHISYGKF